MYQIKRALKTYLVVQEVFAPLVYLSENIYIYIYIYIGLPIITSRLVLMRILEFYATIKKPIPHPHLYIGLKTKFIRKP